MLSMRQPTFFFSSDVTCNSMNHAQPTFKIEEETETELANIIDAVKNPKTEAACWLDTSFTKLLFGTAHLVNKSFTITGFHQLGGWPWLLDLQIWGETDMFNYRPTSILPVISKVAEKWVAKQQTRQLNKGYTPLHPMQFGFCSHHSTETK